MKLYDLKAKKRDGSDLELNTLEGKVVVVVNTATGCGFTPQYEALEKLYEKYHDKGLEILDFPCNQFGHQAPGDDNEIHEFCTAKYKTTFDQLKKIDVNGENQDPVFAFLKEYDGEEKIEGMKNKMAMKGVAKISTTCKEKNDIKWNFTKFLIDKEGNVVGRYSPTFDPSHMEEDILKIL